MFIILHVLTGKLVFVFLFNSWLGLKFIL